MTEQLWRRLVQRALADENWSAAESVLHQLLQSRPGAPDLLDLLGFSLLMQGQAVSAEAALRQALRHGSRQFWTPHKLGDALRAQQRLLAAADAYEQALRWGSDSPLTVRNLLQVLASISHDLALARLRLFMAEAASSLSWDEPTPWQYGAIDATLALGHVVLAETLCQYGCPEPSIRQLAYGAALSRLDLEAALALLSADVPAQLVLKRRLERLLCGCSPDGGLCSPS